MTILQGVLFWSGLLLLALSLWLLFKALREGPQAYTPERKRRVFGTVIAVCLGGIVLLTLFAFVA